MPPIIKRAVIALLLIAAAAFAVEGGEFSTRDLFRQRSERRRGNE